MNKQELAKLLNVTLTKWQKQNASLTAAALTFFIVLPLPSLALIAVAVLARIYGQHQAFQQLGNQISAFAGPSVSGLVAQLLQNAANPLTSFFGSLIGVAFAVSGAVGAFSVLQKTLNSIWEVPPLKGGLVLTVKEKAFPFSLIIGLSLVVLTSTTISTVLLGATVFLVRPLIGSLAPLLLRSLQVLLSLGLGVLLFAIIFKMLPETNVRWSDVWLGATVTAIVFTALNYLFGVYLSLFRVTTLAGTAGALMILLLWLYVMNLFLLFGAQFSKVYADAFGSRYSVGKTELQKEESHNDRNLEIKAGFRIKVRDSDK